MGHKCRLCGSSDLHLLELLILTKAHYPLKVKCTSEEIEAALRADVTFAGPSANSTQRAARLLRPRRVPPYLSTQHRFEQRRQLTKAETDLPQTLFAVYWSFASIILGTHFSSNVDAQITTRCAKRVKSRLVCCQSSQQVKSV